jgi:hypothetical protein
MGAGFEFGCGLGFVEKLEYLFQEQPTLFLASF